MAFSVRSQHPDSDGKYLILFVLIAACAGAPGRPTLPLSSEKISPTWYEDISLDVGVETQDGVWGSVGVSYPVTWGIWASAGYWGGTGWQGKDWFHGWYLGLGYSWLPFAEGD